MLYVTKLQSKRRLCDLARHLANSSQPLFNIVLLAVLTPLTAPSNHSHATLGFYCRTSEGIAEVDSYRLLSKQNTSHPGYRYVRTALDAFEVPEEGGIISVSFRSLCGTALVMYAVVTPLIEFHLSCFD